MATPAANPVPLCVDLDGTLTRTDLLFEAFFVLLKQSPMSIFLCIAWALRGRAYLKEQIAQRVNIDVGVLPYNTELLAWLRDERKSGRDLYLCTATNQRLASQIAAHIGLFTGVFASTASNNLLGKNKARALVEQFGDRGFDYAGDAKADVPVWRQARNAIVVGDKHTAAMARKANAATICFEQKRQLIPLVLKEMRVHQWVKNVLIFVPLLTAHRFDLPTITAACIAFASFSLLASSVYLLNDMLDLDADRRHARKRTRPFASGRLTLKFGIVLTIALLIAGGGLAVLLPWKFGVVLAAYFATTVAYSFVLKRMTLVDVFALACLYTVRVIAGGTATGVQLSYWLILFCVPIFLSLAMVKRYVELDAILRAGKTEAAGRGYITQDMSILRSFGTASAYLAVLVLALYMNTPEMARLYLHPQALWGTFALTLFWVSRIWMCAFRGTMHDDPIVFAFKDPTSLAVIALCGVTVVMAI
ncbi:UbiA family prenyltransferase [Paraburkholderia unamae]|uniref:4-hydroxybenzoate polyprenyltransferase n=1 Tax=Paraburkholderia unamae TaxID=219649 RepID=A0ABX5KK53_9BURK|nr:UbiA family prenyltransferase [Paraburkholderia unamae]PVX82236.1 4-hydroxybenzoate polyprenyltransferase [Paraburkholderia unamae]CAG9272262.1 integral membrane protein [Paraburkholderia unamae]